MVKMDSILRSLIEKIAKTYHDMSLEGNYRKLTVDGRSLEKLRKMLQKYQDVHSNVTALRRKRGFHLHFIPHC